MQNALQEFREVLKPTSWLKELPYWDAWGNILSTADGWLVCGLKIEGVDSHCFAESQLDAISSQFRRWLSSLDEGTSFNIVVEVKNNYQASGFFERYFPKSNQASEISAYLAREKKKYLQDQKELFGTDIYLFIERRVREEEPGLWERWIVGTTENLKESHKKAEAALERVTAATRDELHSVGINTTQLTSQQMIELIYHQLNPTRSARLGCPVLNKDNTKYNVSRFRPLRELLCFSDIEAYKNYFILDDVIHRVLSMKTLPDITLASALIPFIQGINPSANADFRIVYGLNVLNQKEQIRKLKFKGNVRQVLASASTKASNLESQVASDELNSCLQYFFETGQRLLGLSLHFIIRSSSKEVLDDLTTRALSLFRKVNNMEGEVQVHSQVPMFACTLPGNQHKNFSVHRTTTENAADLLPLYEPWRGCKKPITVLKNHLNGLIKFDPFDEELQAYNSILCGSTGSGKSFTTIYLLLACIQKNYPIMIIDVGGSYRKLCAIFSGTYLEVNEGISLNPFFSSTDMQDKGSPQVETKYQFLASVLERLIIEKGKQETGLLNIEKLVIFESLQILYSKSSGTRPRLSDFVEVVEELGRATDEKEKKSAAERVARQLRIWCDGPFGKWFNRSEGIAFESSLVVLDMKGVEGDLKEIILLILIGHAWARIMQQPGPKLVVLDEVWSLLENPATSGFVAELYRTARKYHCGIMSISQSPDDFVRSRVGPAIVSNSIVRYILRLKDGWECLADSLKMTERDVELVQRLQFKKGEFSELYLVFGDRRAVVRVEPSPLEYWICTNHPADLRMEKQLKEKYPHFSTFDALRLLARIYPKGSWHEKAQ